MTACRSRRCHVADCSTVEHQPQRKLGLQQLSTATGGHRADQPYVNLLAVDCEHCYNIEGPSVIKTLLMITVTSGLQYGNVTSAGIPSYQLKWFQSLMKFSSSKFDVITLLLHQLQRLKAPERTQYKLAVLAFKCCNGTALTYLVDELFQPSDFGIRSASTSSLPVHHTRLSTVADHRCSYLECSAEPCHVRIISVSFLWSEDPPLQVFIPLTFV